MMRLSPLLNAVGALTSASTVKAYAHHIVPTTTVILSPNLALKRPIGPGPCICATAAATLGAPSILRCSWRGCGMYSKMSDIVVPPVGRSPARSVVRADLTVRLGALPPWPRSAHASCPMRSSSIAPVLRGRSSLNRKRRGAGSLRALPGSVPHGGWARFRSGRAGDTGLRGSSRRSPGDRVGRFKWPGSVPVLSRSYTVRERREAAVAENRS